MHEDGEFRGYFTIITGPASSKRDYVLIHGIGVSQRYFRPLARRLAKDGRVYLLDLPGFGRSPKPTRRMSIEDYAGFVEDFISTHEINAPILVGQSMGCQVVVEVLARQLKSPLGVLIGPVVNDRERNGFLQALRLMQDGLHEPWQANMIVFTDYLRCGVQWYLKTLPSMLAYATESRIREVKSPLCLIRGEKDPIAPEPWLKELAEASPRRRRLRYQQLRIWRCMHATKRWHRS